MRSDLRFLNFFKDFDSGPDCPPPKWIRRTNWAWIYGTDINVKDDASKTACSVLAFREQGRHNWQPYNPPPSVRLRLIDGKVVPRIPIELFYVYLGCCISLGGSCAAAAKALLAKLAGGAAAQANGKVNRRDLVGCLNTLILGHCLGKGVAVWSGFDECERTLGAAVRRPFAF